MRFTNFSKFNQATDNAGRLHYGMALRKELLEKGLSTLNLDAYLSEVRASFQEDFDLLEEELNIELDLAIYNVNAAKLTKGCSLWFAEKEDPAFQDYWSLKPIRKSMGRLIAVKRTARRKAKSN